MINYDDFSKIELKVAKVLEAVRVEGSDKLLKLQVSVGDKNEAGESINRQILAGVGKFYEQEALIGKEIIIVVNLEPRKLMGEESNGMLLAGSVVKDVLRATTSRFNREERLATGTRNRDLRFQLRLLHQDADEACIEIDLIPPEIAQIALAKARLHSDDEEFAKLAEAREAFARCIAVTAQSPTKTSRLGEVLALRHGTALPLLVEVSTECCFIIKRCEEPVALIARELEPERLLLYLRDFLLDGIVRGDIALDRLPEEHLEHPHRVVRVAGGPTAFFHVRDEPGHANTRYLLELRLAEVGQNLTIEERSLRRVGALLMIRTNLIEEPIDELPERHRPVDRTTARKVGAKRLPVR